MIITPLSVGAFSTNCYIVQDGSSVTLIDAPPTESRKIVNFLKAKNLNLNLIILTHGHFDHVLNLSELKDEFPNVKIAISKADFPYLTDGGELIKQDISFFDSGLFYNKMMSYLPLPCPDILLNDHDRISSFEVLSTPGHTPGSICLLNREEKILFSGDTLFKASIGRTDLQNGNFTQIISSLKKLKELDEDILVLPGHGPSTTIGFEKKNNSYL